MTTFLQDLALKGYNQDAVHAILYESDKDRRRREMRMNVIEAANAHRLEEMKSVLMKVELAAWRRMNGFDRDEVLASDGRPLTPEEYTTFLKDEIDELRDAIFLSEQERDRKRMQRFYARTHAGKSNNAGYGRRTRRDQTVHEASRASPRNATVYSQYRTRTALQFT